MVARTPHALSVVCFVPGEGGMAQDRSRMEHKNKRRVPGVFISYHGASRSRRLALLGRRPEHTTDDTTTTTTRDEKQRPVRDRAPRPAHGMCEQWTWRGCGARLARTLVRVVRHAERRGGV